MPPRDNPDPVQPVNRSILTLVFSACAPHAAPTESISGFLGRKQMEDVSLLTKKIHRESVQNMPSAQLEVLGD